MNKICVNAKTGRKIAGYTQWEAAEKLGVSVRQLSSYENGKQRIPPDIVTGMARVYNQPLLIMFHVRDYELQLYELYLGMRNKIAGGNENAGKSIYK